MHRAVTENGREAENVPVPALRLTFYPYYRSTSHPAIRFPSDTAVQSWKQPLPVHTAHHDRSEKKSRNQPVQSAQKKAAPFHCPQAARQFDESSIQTKVHL